MAAAMLVKTVESSWLVTRQP